MAQLQSACRHGSICQPSAAVQTQRPQCFAVQRNSHYTHVLHLQDILQSFKSRRKDQMPEFTLHKWRYMSSKRAVL